MELNPTAVSLIEAYNFRELLLAEGARGAYNRREPLDYDSWLSGFDLTHLSGLYNMDAAFDGSNSHWKLILGAQDAGNNEVRVLKYDPLRGVTETIMSSESLGWAELSPELTRQYYQEIESGNYLRIENPDGSISGLSISDFLVDYFQRNPTSERAIDYLRNMEITQYDSDNCGPLAFQAALITKWASQGRLPPYRINSTNSRDDDILIEGPYDSNSSGDRSDITYLDDDIQIEGPFDNDDSLGFRSDGILIEEPLELDIVEIGEPQFSTQQNLYWKCRNGLSRIKNSISSKYNSYLNGDVIEIIEPDNSLSGEAPYWSYGNSGRSSNY